MGQNDTLFNNVFYRLRNVTVLTGENLIKLGQVSAISHSLAQLVNLVWFAEDRRVVVHASYLAEQ